MSDAPNHGRYPNLEPVDSVPVTLRGRKSIQLLLCCGVVFALGASSEAGIAPPALTESSAKAAFLYNLTKFIEWPPDSDDSHFVVCVAQGGSIEKAAAGVFAGKLVSGRPVEFRAVSGPLDAPQCRVLFIHGDDAREIGQLLKAADPASTLTVGDSTALLQHRGMLSIVAVDLRLQLYINPESLRASRLQFAPQLLRLAKEWKPK